MAGKIFDKAVLALCLLVFLSFYFLVAEAREERFRIGQPNKIFEVIEKDVFCEGGEGQEKANQCNRMNENYLKFYLSVFLVIAWGGIVRTVIKTFEFSIPYTVVMLISGVLLGLGARVTISFCEVWTPYTKFARTPPELVLYIFLPVLIFESAFSMKAHVFIRSFFSIAVIALLGMFFTTFVTAVGSMQFMENYQWTFPQAALFGSIISATDPVAVVAILKELGASETLSVMIEGESLLNDGVAILLYEILKEIVESPDEDTEYIKMLWKFLQIAVGGPAFGFFMGKITILCLSLVFNDAATEITITLVSAYLTYFVGEFYFEVSGVMAVVLLGVTVSATSTCISPEVKNTVHQFWEMMSFFANTVLFVILGIVISETAINSFDSRDAINVVSLYFALTVIRLVMILILSPVLIRTGYDINWRDLLVMVWGGLRGAVGVCLALEVYKNKKLCTLDQVGSKFLLLTAGIVMCTLLINGTTTKYLLDSLGITAISIGKLQDMGNAVKSITSARVRTITALKHDRFLADANWEVVHKFTHLKDPYAKKHKAQEDKTKKLFEWRLESLKKSPALLVQKLVSEGSLKSSTNVPALPATNSKGNILAVGDKIPDSDSVYHVSSGVVKPGRRLSQGHSHHSLGDGKSDEEEDDYVEDKPFNEFKAIMEESRLRVLKAMKISCWRQYERGYLSEEAVKLLVSEIEGKEDQLLTMLHTDDLRDHWGNKGFFSKMQKNISNFMIETEAGTEPKSACRKPFYRLTSSLTFHIIIYIIIAANFIPIFWTIILMAMKSGGDANQKLFIFCCTIIFTILYLLEFFLKIIGRGIVSYFSSRLNQIDFLVLCISVIETGFTIDAEVNKTVSLSKVSILKVLGLIRLVRLLRAFRPMMPLINRLLEYRINAELFMGYDVGKGYIQALEDALRFLPHMIESKRISKKFKSVLNKDRLATTKELGLLQLDHPGIVIAVKTRHASRSICNQMRADLEGLKLDGLLGEKEFSLLTSKLELNFKKLWSSPSSVKPVPADDLIQNISWSIGNESLLQFLQQNAIEKCFQAGHEIYRQGDFNNGIHLIIDGLVRLHYDPTEEIVTDLREKGFIPTNEFILDLSFSSPTTDYMGTGTIIGELGYLTGRKRAASIVCETHVTLFHWTPQTLELGQRLYDAQYASFESRLWRSFGIKLATEYLHTQNAYSSWTADKIRAHLELALVPTGENYDHLDIPAVVEEAILIFGEVVNKNTGETLQAPSMIPKSWGKIHTADETLPEKLHPKILILPDEQEVREVMEKGSLTTLEKCIVHSPEMAISLADEDVVDTSTINHKETNSSTNLHSRKSMLIVQNMNLAKRRRSTQDDFKVIKNTETTLNIE